MSVSSLLDRFALPLAAAGFVFLIAVAPAPARAASLLGDGSVVDAARGIAYVARPQGGIEALDLATGQAVWRSAAAAKPLALVGGALLAQDEPGPSGALRLAMLDAATGAEKSRADLALPEGVAASVTDNLHGAFRIRAAVLEGESSVLLAWTASATPPSRGFLPPDLSVRAPAGAPVAVSAPPTPGVRRGAARRDLAAGCAIAADDSEAVGIAMAIDRRLAPAVSSVAAVPGLPSIDGRHALASERVAGSLHTYRWSISDRSQGAVVAVLDAPVSLAPFVVAGGKVIYLAQPAMWRDNGVMIQKPLRLRALELATGEESWQAAVRNSAYGGPIPP